MFIAMLTGTAAVAAVLTGTCMYTVQAEHHRHRIFRHKDPSQNTKQDLKQSSSSVLHFMLFLPILVLP